MEPCSVRLNNVTEYYILIKLQLYGYLFNDTIQSSIIKIVKSCWKFIKKCVFQ